MAELNKFKAWYIPQVPMKAFEVERGTAVEAQAALDLITAFSIFEFENKVKPDYSDTGGVAEWDETEQEWIDHDPEVEPQPPSEPDAQETRLTMWADVILDATGTFAISDVNARKVMDLADAENEALTAEIAYWNLEAMHLSAGWDEALDDHDQLLATIATLQTGQPGAALPTQRCAFCDKEFEGEPFPCRCAEACDIGYCSATCEERDAE